MLDAMHQMRPIGSVISALAREAIRAAQQDQESAQITDTYLLALSVHHGGRLATLDRRLSAHAVKGSAEALELIRI